AGLGDRGDAAAQLVAAVAAQAGEEVASKALRVQPDKTGAAGSGEPIRIARCSRPPSRGRKAISRAFSASASGTRASATRSSPVVAASRLNTAAASMTA